MARPVTFESTLEYLQSSSTSNIEEVPLAGYRKISLLAAYIVGRLYPIKHYPSGLYHDHNNRKKYTTTPPDLWRICYQHAKTQTHLCYHLRSDRRRNAGRFPGQFLMRKQTLKSIRSKTAKSLELEGWKTINIRIKRRTMFQFHIPGES